MVVIAVGYALYEVLRYYSPGDAVTAAANARGLISFEHSLHIDFELSANHWLVGHSVLTTLSGYYYGVVHFAATPITLALLWWRRPRIYPWLRSALVVLSFAALVISPRTISSASAIRMVSAA